jgi:hypothetical protein
MHPREKYFPQPETPAFQLIFYLIENPRPENFRKNLGNGEGTVGEVGVTSFLKA